VTISIVSACIEDGLHPLTLLFVLLVIPALLRSDYSRPFMWGDGPIALLFAAYLAVASLGILVVHGKVPFPLFILYFTFGVIMVRALSTLHDRNVAQLVFLSFGLILINCIFTNHLLFGVLLPVYLFVLMGTLLFFQLARAERTHGEFLFPPAGGSNSRTWYGYFGRSLALIVAATAVMFVVIPRPFLVFPGLRAIMSGGGLSDLQKRITYRDMAGMADRNRIAFLVNVEAGKLPDIPYWRGRVLDRNDHGRWYPSGPLRGIAKTVSAEDASTVVYRIIPMRLQSKNLYVWGLPVWITGRQDQRLFVTSKVEAIIDTAFQNSDSYRVVAVDEPAPVSHVPAPINLDREGITPRIEQLALQWSSGYGTAGEKATAVSARLRREYKYELQPLPPPGDVHPIEHFLFETRSGNCEYFAGALCLMLRSLGIPARVVEGFAGKEETPVPTEFVVRFALAHAWVEADLDGSTWTPLDATPASSIRTGGRELWRRLFDYYDRIQYQWIKYVVYFDRADQGAVFGFLGGLLSGRITFPVSVTQGARPLLIGTLIVAGILVPLLLLLHRARRRSRDVSEIYLATMKLLTRKGILRTIRPWHEQNTAEILEREPHCRDALARFMDLYLKARFGSPNVRTDDLVRAQRELLENV